MKMWIARDGLGLCLYIKEPYLTALGWASEDEYFIGLDDNLFPEVTYKNSPMEVEVEIKLVKEE